MKQEEFEKVSEWLNLIAVWLGGVGFLLWFDAVASVALFIPKEIQILMSLVLIALALVVLGLNRFAIYRRNSN